MECPANAIILFLWGGDDTTGDVMEPMSAMRAHFGWSGNVRAFAFNRRHLSHRNAA